MPPLENGRASKRSQRREPQCTASASFADPFNIPGEGDSVTILFVAGGPCVAVARNDAIAKTTPPAAHPTTASASISTS